MIQFVPEVVGYILLENFFLERAFLEKINISLENVLLEIYIRVIIIVKSLNICFLNKYR